MGIEQDRIIARKGRHVAIVIAAALTLFDVAELRRDYPNLILAGGISVVLERFLYVRIG